MASHVALLRGINVGGKNKVPMAALRDVVTSLGHARVSTYIQSGNVLFDAADSDTAGLADALEAALAGRFGIRASVVVLTREDLATILAGNPYPDEPNPKLVHVVFLTAALPENLLGRIAATQSAVAEKGSRDSVQAARGALFLHTPDGFGTSELAQAVMRMVSADAGKATRGVAGTARNWATATKLLALCGETR